MIQLAKGNKMMYGKLICAAFVPCVHRLRSTEKVCDLLLREVVIFTQIAYAFYISEHTFHPLVSSMPILYISKDIYY